MAGCTLSLCPDCQDVQDGAALAAFSNSVIGLCSDYGTESQLSEVCFVDVVVRVPCRCGKVYW